MKFTLRYTAYSLPDVLLSLIHCSIFAGFSLKPHLLFDLDVTRNLLLRNSDNQAPPESGTAQRSVVRQSVLVLGLIDRICQYISVDPIGYGQHQSFFSTEQSIPECPMFRSLLRMVVCSIMHSGPQLKDLERKASMTTWFQFSSCSSMSDDCAMEMVSRALLHWHINSGIESTPLVFPFLGIEVAFAFAVARRRSYDLAIPLLESTLSRALSEWSSDSFEYALICAELIKCCNLSGQEPNGESLGVLTLQSRHDPRMRRRADTVYLKIALVDSLVGQCKYKRAVDLLDGILELTGLSDSLVTIILLRSNKIKRRLWGYHAFTLDDGGANIMHRVAPRLGTVSRDLQLEYLEELNSTAARYKQMEIDGAETMDMIRTSIDGLSHDQVPQSDWRVLALERHYALLLAESSKKGLNRHFSTAAQIAATNREFVGYLRGSVGRMKRSKGIHVIHRRPSYHTLVDVESHYLEYPGHGAETYSQIAVGKRRQSSENRLLNKTPSLHTIVNEVPFSRKSQEGSMNASATTEGLELSENVHGRATSRMPPIELLVDTELDSKIATEKVLVDRIPGPVSRPSGAERFRTPTDIMRDRKDKETRTLRESDDWQREEEQRQGLYRMPSMEMLVDKESISEKAVVTDLINQSLLKSGVRSGMVPSRSTIHNIEGSVLHGSRRGESRGQAKNRLSDRLANESMPPEISEDIVKRLEKHTDKGFRRSYREGSALLRVQDSALVLKIAFTFLPGRDRLQVNYSEQTNIMGKEPDQKDANWRVNTAASLLSQFDVTSDLSIVQTDQTPMVLVRTIKGTNERNGLSQDNKKTLRHRIRDQDTVTIDSEHVIIVNDVRVGTWDLQGTLIEGVFPPSIGRKAGK